MTVFSVRCRDRRYCAGAIFTDEPAAHMAARGEGWLIHVAADLVTCPACLNQRHPRRDA